MPCDALPCPVMPFHVPNALPCPSMLFQLNKRGGGVARHGDALFSGGETCPVEPSGHRACDFARPTLTYKYY